ncbi:MAG: hypothetical protein IPP80_13325 [Ignavibacteria bacterium]|nr:hypothetical protein [Ignavibacteria bacterium]
MRTLILPLLLLLAASVEAMAQTPTSRLSGNLMMWLHNETVAPARNNGAIVHRAQGVDYLSAFAKVADNIDVSKLSALGVIVGTKAGNIWTVRIPKGNVLAFTRLSGIDYGGTRPACQASHGFSQILCQCRLCEPWYRS